jgi:hypothetical protein
MGFADACLLKAGLRGPLIDTAPHPDIHLIVTIPVYNEYGLERCLDSLFHCGGSGHVLPFRTEVLILVNAPRDAPAAALEQNRRTMEATYSWIGRHAHPSIDFHIRMDHTFGRKEAGVGLARKILMDEAVRRFSAAGNPRGIIASLDADVVVDPGYLEALASHFGSLDPDGCSVYFEHPLSPESPGPFETFAPEVYDAITLYELHLRYYINAVRSTGYPYAFHTVGSCFAVRAEVYCMEGGMNRRQGGEDFYFIQKVAQRGRWSNCSTTRVVPSPRPSGRVPFGTGPAVERFTRKGIPLRTYHPETFRMLEGFFSELERLGSELPPGTILNSQPGVLRDFLGSHHFADALMEIRSNSASPGAFRKRFWRWFSMFRIMKFLHYARDNGYPDMEVGEAASRFLFRSGTEEIKTPGTRTGLRGLLEIYRKIDRQQPTSPSPPQTHPHPSSS